MEAKGEEGKFSGRENKGKRRRNRRELLGKKIIEVGKKK